MQPLPVFCFLAKHAEQVVKKCKEFAPRCCLELDVCHTMCCLELDISIPSLLITRLAEPLRGTQ